VCWKSIHVMDQEEGALAGDILRADTRGECSRGALRQRKLYILGWRDHNYECFYIDRRRVIYGRRSCGERGGRYGCEDGHVRSRGAEEEDAEEETAR
jgi:hypothetical protein